MNVVRELILYMLQIQNGYKFNLYYITVMYYVSIINQIII